MNQCGENYLRGRKLFMEPLNNCINLRTKKISEISGRFFIPAFQRGYRWGVEATRLLDDIIEMNEKDDGYCLQPIVVKKLADGSYELIDGQQRLTTLFLIYKVIGKVIPISKARFTLTYEVRKRSAEFLESISETSEDGNIDFHFMKEAYKSIQKWFEDKAVTKPTILYDFWALLENKVYVIWYEAGPSEDSNALFQRLNIGKIPLTSSELVKAMFLCASSRDGDRSEERQQEIALQWDNIEKELHEDSFWYFLTNSRVLEYQTRIDLVLNLISGKFDDPDKYATFFHFDDKRKTEKLPDIWEEIQHTYLVLKDWRKDHDSYHLIGYLIATGKSIKDIYDLSKGKTKTEFIASLKELIKQTVRLKDRNYGELSYENANDKKAIFKLLLLFNVLSTMNNGEHSEWFAFDKFKKSNWSLEHIHAQQSQGLTTDAKKKEWIELHIPSVKLLNKDDPELDQLMAKAAKEDYKFKNDEFEDIRRRAERILSEDTNTGYLHSISNLALLRKDDNSALSNSTFDVKRNAIVEMDMHGQFIPFCTRMVFLKYYTPSEKNSVHFWGAADRESYIEHMNRVLSDYIEEPINLSKGDEIHG